MVPIWHPWNLHGMYFRPIMVPTLELDKVELIYSKYSTLMNFAVIHKFGRKGGMESGASRAAHRASDGHGHLIDGGRRG
jgi:hypothetical protein